jgi:hypothetical protein
MPHQLVDRSAKAVLGEPIIALIWRFVATGLNE